MGISQDDRTIEDFGAQWTRFLGNEGYYGSVDLLQDILGPLVTLDQLRDTRVADIGSGTGRIVNMLLDAGVRSVVAVEPSRAMDVLRQNTSSRAARVICQQVPGHQLQASDLDYVFAIGVLHHIVDPAPVVSRAFAALRPGGTLVIWVYGREGNEIYLAVIGLPRLLTRVLPDWLLVSVAHVLNVLLAVYIFACRWLPLPLRSYVRSVLAKFSWRKRLLVIFDQLNPAYARYYCRREVERLLGEAGFEAVQVYHRHGYGWTAIGSRPS